MEQTLQQIDRERKVIYIFIGEALKRGFIKYEDVHNLDLLLIEDYNKKIQEAYKEE